MPTGEADSLGKHHAAPWAPSDLGYLRAAGYRRPPPHRGARRHRAGRTHAAMDNGVHALPRARGGHGFRATFSTIVNEAVQLSPDVIERQLAHKERNEVRAAYH